MSISRRSRVATQVQCRALLDAPADPLTGPLEARSAALHAQALAREAGDPLLEAEAVLLLGRHRLSVVYPLEMLAWLERAAQVFETHRRRADVAACEVLRAQALLDAGREALALRVAEAALGEPAIKPQAQLRAELLRSLALRNLGRFDSALEVVAECAVPRARAAGGGHALAEALGVHAVVLMLDTLARRTPHPWSGTPLGLSERHLAQPARPEAIARLVDEAERAVPSGSRWYPNDTLRDMLIGSFDDPPPARAATARMTTRAMQLLSSDPAHSAWVLLLRGSIEQRLGDVDRAMVSMTQAAELAESLGMIARLRHAQAALARLRELTGDAAGALHAHKRFATLQMHSVLGTEAAFVPSANGPLADVPRACEAGVSSARLPTSAPLPVRRAVKLVEGWREGKLSVGDLVEASGVARRTLELMVKEHAHVTLAELIRRRGLARAAEQLRDTALPVSEVAACAGYRSAAAFGQAFRAEYGLSPTAWRRETALPSAPAGATTTR